MSKRIFSPEQVEELAKNPNVLRCSEKSISYHQDFKLSATRQYESGLSAIEIFKRAGFNIDVIGRKKPKWCLGRWLKVLRLKGIHELSIEARGRGKGGGRPKTRWSNEKERLKYLEVQVAYLKAENAFLAKLRKKRLN